MQLTLEAYMAHFLVTYPCIACEADNYINWQMLVSIFQWLMPKNCLMAPWSNSDKNIENTMPSALSRQDDQQ